MGAQAASGEAVSFTWGAGVPVCERCRLVDQSVRDFTECSECGTVLLCGDCAALHRREIAEET